MPRFHWPARALMDVVAKRWWNATRIMSGHSVISLITVGKAKQRASRRRYLHPVEIMQVLSFIEPDWTGRTPRISRWDIGIEIQHDAATISPLSMRVQSLPAVGIEPTHSCEYWILSPARLPIPPRRLV